MHTSGVLQYANSFFVGALVYLVVCSLFIINISVIIIIVIATTITITNTTTTTPTITTLQYIGSHRSKKLHLSLP